MKIDIKKLMLGKFGMIAALLILMAIYASQSPVFLTAGNLRNILIQSGANAIIAIGMTFVIISGNIDLSVGSTLALASVFGGKMMLATGSVLTGILTALVVGVILGTINGLIVAYLNFQPFIATLSTMWLFRGIAYVYTGGQAVTSLPPDNMALAMNSFLFTPYIVWLIIICYSLCHVLLTNTTLGRKIYAIGDNAEASRLSGINVKSIKVFIFAFSGLMAALSGVIVMSRLNSAQPIAGQSYEMYAIAAAVIGGASLTKGGIGGVIGTLIGAVFIATLQNGLTILNISSFWQQVCMGIVILITIGIDELRKKVA